MGGEQIRAAVLHGIGEIPRYEPFPAPVPGAGKSVVTVSAAALKPSERWMAAGAHYTPPAFPQVVGFDGVGTLAGGRRVAFFGPVAPYGGMAERALVRDGAWFGVPSDADEVTAAAILNPGGAAWKTVIWEGRLTAGESVLVLGATGASGRIAAQLAISHGARVAVAGRDPRVLGQLKERGADAVIRADAPPGDLAAAIAAAGPYDLIIDYLWGAPAEALFIALQRMPAAGTRARYILVGMSAGEMAGLPAMTLRKAPVQLVGSGTGEPPPLADAAAAFASLLRQAATGEIALDIDTAPLAEVERIWPQAGTGRRIVFVP